MTKKSKEFFYLDADGNKQDADLHEPILAAGDNATVKNIGKKYARKAGLSEAAIMKLYADPDE